MTHYNPTAAALNSVFTKWVLFSWLCPLLLLDWNPLWPRVTWMGCASSPPSGLLGAARWGGWVTGGVCRSPAWNPARPIPKSWPTRAQSPYARHRCDQPWCVQDHTVSFFSVMGTGWWDKEERREKKKKQHMGKTQNEICWLGTQRNKAQCKAEPKQGEPWKPGLVVGSVSKALQRLSCSERWDISYIFCIS